MSPDETFDWVKARATCTSKMLFKELKQVVEADVRSAQSRVCDRFSLNCGQHEDVFSVRLDAGDGSLIRTRVFELVNQEIRVYRSTPESGIILTGTASLVGAKDCLIEVTEQDPMRLWEFSRLALEDFFFAGH